MRAPKATGKRGIGPGPDKDEESKPLDAAKDFDTRTTKEGSTADPATAEKGSLLVEQPPKPKVVGNRMELFYDKPIFGKYKDVVTVSLVCTMPVEKEHEDLLPKLVRDAYHDVKK